MESVDRNSGYVCVCAQRAGVKGSVGCARVFGGIDSTCMLGPVEFRRLELYYQYQQGLANIGQEVGSLTCSGGGNQGVAIIGSSVDEGVCRSCGSRSSSLVRVDSSFEGSAVEGACTGTHIAGESDKSGNPVSFPGGSYLSHDQLLEPKGSDSFVELKCTIGDGRSQLLGVAESVDTRHEFVETCEKKSEVLCVPTVKLEGVFDEEERKRKNLRNREARKCRKERKKKRQSEGFDWRHRDVNASSELRQSLERKWRMENDLATERARRQLEVLSANDIQLEVKKYRTKINADTEMNMVSIENTHAKLRQTGNLPEERGGGFVETVVSGAPGLESGSGTISPDSSASMAEFRACQKALLDAEREIAEYKRKVKIASEKYGFPLEQVDFLDKEVWTDTQTNQDILDEIYPNGYGKDTSLFEDGKFRAIGV